MSIYYAERPGRGYGALALFILVVALVAFVGAQFSPASDPAWYRALAKPSFNPPDWIFAPVWSVLYLTIAVAGWLVWRQGGRTLGSPVVLLWLVQLLLNGLWTPLFFGLKRVDLALIEIVALLAAILCCIALFRRISTVAALLFVPYLAWVGFATALTAAIWSLNS